MTNPITDGKSKTVFQKKTPWQRDDCLFCENKAVIEAVNNFAMIRCCKNKDCKRKAIDLAKEIKNIFQQ